jgi:hypothetical protein
MTRTLLSATRAQNHQSAPKSSFEPRSSSIPNGGVGPLLCQPNRASSSAGGAAEVSPRRKAWVTTGAPAPPFAWPETLGLNPERRRAQLNPEVRRPHPRKPFIYATRPRSPRPAHRGGRLIANPRLKFGLSGKDSSQLQIPNRERIAIFHRALPFASSFEPQVSRLSNLEPAMPNLQLLIANLGLEFRVSPICISELKFSNRKFSSISRSLRRASSFHPTASRDFSHGREGFIPSVKAVKAIPVPLALPHPRRPFASTSRGSRTGRSFSSIPQPQASSTQNLIDTPRLEFPASLTTSAISNFLIETKTPFSNPLAKRTQQKRTQELIFAPDCRTREFEESNAANDPVLNAHSPFARQLLCAGSQSARAATLARLEIVAAVPACCVIRVREPLHTSCNPARMAIAAIVALSSRAGTRREKRQPINTPGTPPASSCHSTPL